MAGNNGKNEDEHPKPLIEVMSSTQDAITGYAAAKEMSPELAALTLILNELRCIHWHYDLELAQKEEANAGKREG